VPARNAADFVRHVTRRIAQVRRSKRITQAAAAHKLGVAVNNWQRIEAGQNLTLHTLARVAAVLGVSPVELITEGEKKPSA